MHVSLLCLSEAFCHSPVSSFVSQVGAWSHWPSSPRGPAGAAVSVRQNVLWCLVSSWPGETGQQPVPSLFPHIQCPPSSPSGWAVCSPDGCSSLQWLADIKHSQAALCVCGHPPIRGASAALPPWLGKAQMTSQLEKKPPGGFPTMAILAIFPSAQSEWKELQMPQLS